MFLTMLRVLIKHLPLKIIPKMERTNDETIYLFFFLLLLLQLQIP